MSPPWIVIESLVHDLGDLFTQVHLAERTLSSDPRTRAARDAFEQATDAVCTAIDETSAAAAERASSAIAETRALLDTLGVAIRTSRTLVGAAHDLIARSERERLRAAALRDRVLDRRRR